MDRAIASDAKVRYGRFAKNPQYIVVFALIFGKSTQPQKNLHPNLHPAVSIGGVVDQNLIQYASVV